ncbi:MAG: hypothetical protein ABIJ52_19325 [Pseudomonadota bacterium]|nr:hypothetical protein [Pseudomonadota bacterium]
MSGIVTIVKIVAVFAATTLLGNMFLDEVKKSNIRKEPWYRPYLSLPGIIIIAATFFLPILIWIIK